MGICLLSSQIGTFTTHSGDYFLEPLMKADGSEHEDEHSKPHLVYRHERRRSAPHTGSRWLGMKSTLMVLIGGWHGGTVLRSVSMALLVWSFHVLPCCRGVFPKFSGVPPQSNNMWKELPYCSWVWMCVWMVCVLCKGIEGQLVWEGQHGFRKVPVCLKVNN